jgi:CDP-glucose 4,6-dehydratase
MERWSTVENLVTSNLFWQDRRVFVTGTAGLVGSWLVADLLAAKAQVIGLIHHPDPRSHLYQSGLYRDISIVQGNLEDYGTLEYTINKYEIDTVFHLGAQAIVGAAYRSPLNTFESNIRGTYNLLEACRQHSNLVRRVVVASSDKAYGTHTELPYTEDMALQGKYPYEVSKSCADLICQMYYHTYALPVAIARCGNIYGGGDLNWSRIVPEAIRCCLKGKQLEIRSDGTFVRDYIYVKDVATAYMRLAERLDDPRVKGQAFNFGPWHPLSVLELVERIYQLMGCSLLKPKILNSANGEIHSQYLDYSKAQQILEWQPGYTLEQGLQETILWYKNYLSSSSEDLI